MYSLLATTFNQFRNRPLAFLHASRHCGSAADRSVHLAQVVIREIEAYRSLKVESKPDSF